MMMGMGSIVGTGVFVSIGIAAEVAGPHVIFAIALASLVAICNGLSSAQLAANHPVSGGTYEYGYRWLSPRFGFVAGWLFVSAKSASAATAALGFAGYSLHALQLDHQRWLLPVAFAALVLLTTIVLLGIHRSSTANILIVLATLLSLIFFVIAGFSTAVGNAGTNLSALFTMSDSRPQGFLQATAIMFVAYTGYGRIATLGEEVKNPRHTIPRAIVATLVASMVLYVSVALVAVSAVGAHAFSNMTRQGVAPLEVIASGFGIRGAGMVLAVGAMTAMLGVLLNLLLGLSRVILAMGRRGDLPAGLASVSKSTSTPWAATLCCAVIIGCLMLLGDVRIIWSFSAFTVLVYYALTNLCALRLQPSQRLYPIWTAWCGLAACAFLAFWVDWMVWTSGLGLIALGLVWQQVVGRKPSTS